MRGELIRTDHVLLFTQYLSTLLLVRENVRRLHSFNKVELQIVKIHKNEKEIQPKTTYVTCKVQAAMDGIRFFVAKNEKKYRFYCKNCSLIIKAVI